MKNRTFLKLCAVLLMTIIAGCAMQKEIYEPDVLPRLREYQPIVCTTPGRVSDEFHVMVQVFIDDNGNVSRVFVPESTGFQELDDSITATVKRWKFYPAEVKGHPVALLISQLLTIRFEPPIKYTMAEIVVPTTLLADSALADIRNGSEFEEVAKKISKSKTAVMGGYLGEIELKSLRPDIYQVVKKLSPGAITEPLAVDHSFIIYKRIK